MRPSIFIATAVSGIIVALGVIALLKTPPEVSRASLPPTPTNTGRPPAFHLEATPEQRSLILASAFQNIAGDRPERLGTLKDDIALLLDDPAAVGYVIDQWHRRRNEGRYADAAFADLFRLVKRPEFVDPTAALLQSDLPEIRAKGLLAAQTQASPRLGPLVLEIYRDAALDGDRRVAVKLDALRAALASGGDSLGAIVLEAFADQSEEVAVQALTFAADTKLDGAPLAARRVLETTKSRRVSLHAAAVLMRFGDSAGTNEVLAALNPADPALASDAAHLVSKYRVTAALPALLALRPKATGEIKRLFTLALLRLGDQATWDDVLAAADGSGGDGELEALQLLAASGNVDATPILLVAIDRGGPARIRAIAGGIATAGEPAMLPVVQRLIEQNVGHPAELDEAPRVGGEAIVPRLGELLGAAIEPAAILRYLSWLGQIGGKAARDVMLRERERIPHYVDQQLRLVDLESRRTGIAAAPVSAR